MNGNLTSGISSLAIVFSAILGLSSVTAIAANGTTPAGVNDVLQQKALMLLRDALRKEDRWIKVHAAESLLSLAHAQEVRDVFERELASRGNEPKYRIGIWRVLAQAAPDAAQRQQWIGKIRAAFLDPAGPDRLHAAESLAKLGYHVQDHEADAFKLVADEGDRPLSVNTRWVLANGDESDQQLSLIQLLESKKADTRLNAAYALRNLPTLSAPAQKKLWSTFLNEPAESSDRVYVLTAVLAHAPSDRQMQIKAVLLLLANTADQAAQYEICATLAKVGRSEDLPFLSRLLDDPNSDVRVGAADAVLRIERRNSHPVL